MPPNTSWEGPQHTPGLGECPPRGVGFWLAIRKIGLGSSRLAPPLFAREWAKTALATDERIKHDGFMSTSKGGNAAFGGNVKLDIISKSGVDVKPLSLHASENEVLLPHGVQFEVKKVQQVDGKWIITMEQL